MSNRKPLKTLLPPSVIAAAQAPSGDSLADDLLRGATAIKEWLGLDTEQQIYNARQRTKIPVFPLPGFGVAASKTELRRWVAQLQQADLEKRAKRAAKRR